MEQTLLNDKLKAKDLMTGELVTMRPQMRVKDVIQILKDHRHGAFPSRGAAGPSAAADGIQTSGMILRTQVLKMLQYRIGWYMRDPSEISYPATQLDRYELQSRLDNIPYKVAEHVEDFPATYRISDHEADTMSVDFTYFMNRHPFMVTEDVPMARAYRLFRQIGLRHLLVTRAQPAVVGIITRKDLIEETAQLAVAEEAANADKAAEAYKATRHGLPNIPYDAYDRNHASMKGL